MLKGTVMGTGIEAYKKDNIMKKKVALVFKFSKDGIPLLESSNAKITKKVES